ncbi:recombinase family protein [Anaerotignum lactatifermentans]|uniref:recombinase family protein n=1 Tax=Anaerotignum lactatifermentans TaxID=160404 RepID=UPI001FAEDD3A|nr:recombinase family protein [Anaerotignum lactatifermentans]
MEKSEQLLTILSSIAQSEAENISANSKWAVQRRFQNGTYKISTPAYGYEKDENGELLIQSEEARVVRRIFEAYLGGKGCYTIAKELQAEGVPTIRNKGKWHEVVVQEILLNPVYEGNLIYQKTYSTSCLPFTRKRNDGTYPKYLITENHPPIITKEEAEAVRQIYEYRSQSVKNKASSPKRYVFSGRVRCGICGNTFRRQKIYMGRPYEAVQWCCKGHLQDMTKCNQKAVREEVIQEAFVHMWNRLAGAYEEIFLPLLSALKAAPEGGEESRNNGKTEYSKSNGSVRCFRKFFRKGAWTLPFLSRSEMHWSRNWKQHDETCENYRTKAPLRRKSPRQNT